MAKKLWGGRFKKGAHPLFERFGSSIGTDARLAECDLIGSFLHVCVLYGSGLITKTESLSLKKAIQLLLADAHNGVLKIDPSCEDIHTCVQNLLEKKCGKTVLKLQTCRSRNDQVVFDTRFYCLEESVVLHRMLGALNKSLKALGKQHMGLVIPGYTHMQHAQPIYFKDYCSAYEAMFAEDAARLECFVGRLELTLGSGALAGTPIPASVYKQQIKKALKELGLDEPLYEVLPPKNSLVVVSDRDFVAELLSILAIIGMHVSRLCEDLILWSSKEFDFIELGDEFCTGSSLMPQKKNPDALELMRGATGILYGNLMSVLTTLKGLPLSYNRDLQWDKAPLFSSLDIVRYEVVILDELFKSIKVKKENIEKQLKDESLYATDLADLLVSKGVPFGEAHEAIGKLVRYALTKNKLIRDMSELELKQFSAYFSRAEVLKRLDPGFSVSLKKSIRRP
jgi:argininosuccinate lyase